MKRIIVTIIIVIALIPMTTFAEETDDHRTQRIPLWSQVDDTGDPGFRGPGMQRGPRGMGHMPERKHLEQFRMLKLLELLDLNEDQEAPFITAFNDVRRTMRKLGEKRHELLSTLAGGLRDSTLSESDIGGLYGDLLANRKERQEAVNSFLSNARDILTPYQFGKLIVFEERFERQLLERLKEFRGRHRGSMNGK